MFWWFENAAGSKYNVDFYTNLDRIWKPFKSQMEEF